MKKDRVLIYNYEDNPNGQIPIRVYKPSETTIHIIKQKNEKTIRKTLKEKRKVNKTIKKMTQKVNADELRRHIRSLIPQTT